MSEFQSNVLARYGYLPVSSSMRLLWFFLEGDLKPHSINIPINTNVEGLKATIFQRVKILRDSGKDPDSLILLKVFFLLNTKGVPSDFLF
jgi:hypothetical protein